MLLLSVIFLSGLNHIDFWDVEKKPGEWSKNPFVKNGQNLALEDLSLFAIVYSKNHSAALINEQIVQVGDKISGFEVVSIEKSEVVIRGETGVFKLNLKRVKK